MESLLNLELNEARRHELERASSQRRKEWPDDGLAPRLHNRESRALHPAVVLARILSRR